jgi:glutathione S-transferase
MAPHAVLNEIGCERKLVFVDAKAGAQKRPDYLALNPHGRVPTLVHDGTVMYEAAAIALYLCERHPEANLMPPPGDPDRARFLQWIMYLTNTLQEELQHWWHGEAFVEEPRCHAPLKATAEKNLDRMWRFFDGVLASPGPYLLGPRFSAADIYLAMLTRWSRDCARPAWTYPHLARLVERVKARPAYARMLQEEGIATVSAI